MVEYKRFIQNQLDKVKSTANDLISSRSDERVTVELELGTYEALQQLADTQHISVQALVNYILDQHLASASMEPTPITVDKKEENPLLYLDAICKFED
jgi:hypothetical protein